MKTKRRGKAMKRHERFSDKLRELILYVAQKSVDDPNWGATKLNKILFEADRLAHIRLGHSITGKAYQKLIGGPAPRALLPVQTNMIATGDIIIEPRPMAGYAHPQRRLIAKRDPRNVFSAAEKAVIDDAIRILWPLTGKQASDRSHRFLAWRCVDYGETIPFEALLVHRPSEVTPAILEYAKGLIPVAKKLAG